MSYPSGPDPFAIPPAVVNPPDLGCHGPLAEATTLDHEVAVLRPRPGDVVVFYLDPTQLRDPGMLARMLTNLRERGVIAGVLPRDTVVTTVASDSDPLRPVGQRVQEQLNAWLAPFGYHAVPLGLRA